MNYIYDVVLNFQEERLLDFFEWTKEDIIEHIKRIPIFRITTSNLTDIIKNNIIINKDFLQKIKNKTLGYQKTKDLKYTALFTDLNRVVGVEFSSSGEILCRSSLLLDEEEDIILDCQFDSTEKIYYKIISKIENSKFLTRKEQKMRNYILKELDEVYKSNNVDKLNYLYKEIYNDLSGSFKTKYLKLNDNIKNNYESKYNVLYDILKLTYTKK